MNLKQLAFACFVSMFALMIGSPQCLAQAGDAEYPIPIQERRKLTDSLKKSAEQLTEELIDAGSKRGGLLSRRGDAWLFLGEFNKSVADYEAMVEIDPTQGDSHWRRGIARFYAGKAKEAAQQFEAYHSFDDIDRENGIWRYFSQFRAYGPEKAKAGLLKYRKTDREPFPDVYRLFSGDTTPKEILEAIRKAEISSDEREKRFFYAQLYIGLNHAVEGRAAQAIVHLRESTANSWGPKAGYGPHYMWHVGRVHLDLLLAKKQQLKDAVRKGAGKPPAASKPAAQPDSGR